MKETIKLNIHLKEYEFSSLKEFGAKMYLYPEESFALINTKKFLTILKKYDSDLYFKVEELRKKETAKEAFLFKIQYLFAPVLPLQHYKNQYLNYEQLGRRIINGAPKMDIYIGDFLRYGLLSYYMRHVGDDQNQKELYSFVLKLEHEFTLNEARAYFKLGFYLDKRREIVYRRRGYKDAKSFFEMILSETMIRDFARDFEKNQYIFAWLELNGYEKEIADFESIVASVEEWEEK